MDGTGSKDLTIVHEITIDQIGFEPEGVAIPSAVERFLLHVCLTEPSIRPSPPFEILDLGEIESIGATNRLASIRRFIALAVKVTLVCYSVVDNPSSVVFIIFGYILSAGALTDHSKVSTAAKARRAMGERDLAKPSKDFGKNMAKIETSMRACKAWIDKARSCGYHEPTYSTDYFSVPRMQL
ncbi:hypothetical protein N7519_009573 [Penicillium mononematosum]|uniref:uncharacterized protein n=1 Tax=Penicillium mononematosum TaxID=268346 RepID=UPI0025485ED0|nr:uncharacterized protein N7519_009573 [Penicillium mononematosum]KAJ6179112.1 hypothetical protein N7519_009573 [Penicillium mononematosum]